MNRSTEKKRRALVVGGSMGGLFAAAALLRHGWDVQLYERSTVQLSGRGAGIMTHPTLSASLAAIGIDSSDDSLGVPIVGRRTFNRDGSLYGDYPFHQIATSWEHLFQLLRSAVPSSVYHLGKNVTEVREVGDEVIATCADGSTTHVDLLVAADGIRSGVRAKLAPQTRPTYSGYVAWRGLIDLGALTSDTANALKNHLAFCLPKGEQMLSYPVAGSGPGHTRMSFVWYRPVDEKGTLPRLFTDDAGHRHEHSIPPPLIAKSVIAEMRADCERIVAPQFAEVVRVCAAPFIQPIYDLESERMAFGRIALVGDAAFVARPHVGAGVTKAGNDGLALVDALAANDDVPTALRAFEKVRLPDGRRFVVRARQLGAYMQAHPPRDDAERAAAIRFSSADAIMRETASLAFLAEPL
jgi:2-polyprenyl-6-methoxyphenol hydroxylase-like FAD-dependent oxidoreductase